MNNVVNNTTYRKYDTDDRKFKPSEANGGNDFTNGPSDDEFDVLKEQVTSNKNQITSVKGRITTLENKVNDIGSPLIIHGTAEGTGQDAVITLDTTWQDIYDCMSEGNVAYIVEPLSEFMNIPVSEGSFSIRAIDSVFWNDSDPEDSMYAVAISPMFFITPSADGYPTYSNPKYEVN